MENNFLVKIRNIIEGAMKFPSLHQGETAVQVGFDLSSKNIVSDVVVMLRRVGKIGRVIAIDPDPFNHDTLRPITTRAGYNVTYVQKATYSRKTEEDLVLTTRASWNKLKMVQGSIDNKKKSGNTIKVAVDTLDSILEELEVPPQEISHIHITNNGAEYHTLLGLTSLLEKSQNVSLHVRCGRGGEIGHIDGVPDHELIIDLLKKHNFDVCFFRARQSFYWGVLNKLILKGINEFTKGDKSEGVVIATKGNKKMKWYQSYA